MNSTLGRVVAAIAGVVVLLLTAPSLAEGQEEEAAVNAVYAEAVLWGAPGVNYERLLTRRLAGRIGVSTLDGGSVPLMVKYLAGGGDHRAEVGLGAWLFPSDMRVGGVSALGYRYHPQAGGPMFRTTLMPVLGQRGRSTFLLSASLGYAF